MAGRLSGRINSMAGDVKVTIAIDSATKAEELAADSIAV